MRSSFAKSVLAVIVLSSVSLTGNTAATDSTLQNSFQTQCIDSWMKRLDNIRDKVDYKNFGEKYCECASQHPLDNQEAINKTMQLCMSQTLLQDTMDSLENEVGLDKAAGEEINEYCEDRFTLVFPAMNDKDKETTARYCSCAEPKLAALLKTADSMTDKEYSNEIKKIASSCSVSMQEQHQTSSANSSQATTLSTEDEE